MKRIVLWLLRSYQRLNPTDSFLGKIFPFGKNSCRFFPTCSQYAYQAVEKYGVLKGLALGFWRILRCNPWNRGGVDLLK